MDQKQSFEEAGGNEALMAMGSLTDAVAGELQRPDAQQQAVICEGPDTSPEHGRESTNSGCLNTSPSEMTVAEFVEERFVPEHILLLRYAGQSFYQYVLRHLITPEEVDRIFSKNVNDHRKTVRTLAAWPYLNQMRLRDVRAEDIIRITDAALARGYSVSTVRHIRIVISSIFSHAIRENHFFGENPVRSVKPLRKPIKDQELLTSDQAKFAFRMMRYPEREFTLIGALTGMSPSEIFGLQWRDVNAAADDFASESARIPAMTLVVRQRWYRGTLDPVKGRAARSIAIPELLLPVLTELRTRSPFHGLDDFVLVSKLGTPISYDNLMSQRLRPIARHLGVPSVSPPAFRLELAVLARELRAPSRTTVRSQHWDRMTFEKRRLAS